MRGFNGSLAQPGVSFDTGSVQQTGGRLYGVPGQVRQSYSGRLSSPVGTSGGGVVDRTVPAAVASVSPEERTAASLARSPATIGIPTTGFSQQQLPGGRLADRLGGEPLPRQLFGDRGESADDQDYSTLLRVSRSQYDRNRAAALSAFDSQTGENRTAYEAQVAAARAAHEQRYAPLVQSARTAYDTENQLAQEAFARRANTAEGTYNYIRSRPSNTTFTTNYIREAEREYQATRGGYRPPPFKSPAPAFEALPFPGGGEFSYPEFTAPERRSRYRPPTGTAVAQAAPTFTPQHVQGEIPQGIQWYSAQGGYHFRPEDIISRDTNGLQVRATRYNGFQTNRSFRPDQVYEQTAALTPEALRDYSIYSGTILGG